MLASIREGRVKASNETLDALRAAGYGAELPEGLVIEGRSLCRPPATPSSPCSGFMLVGHLAFKKLPQDLPSLEPEIPDSAG